MFVFVCLESGLAVIEKREQCDVAPDSHPGSSVRDPEEDTREGHQVFVRIECGHRTPEVNGVHVNGNNGINQKAAWTWNKGYLRGRARALDVLPTLKSASRGRGADNALTQCSAEVCTRIITC